MPAAENFNGTKLWSSESSQPSHIITVSRVSTVQRDAYKGHSLGKAGSALGTEGGGTKEQTCKNA